MNKIFTGTLFNLHNCLIKYTVPKGFAKDAFLQKKLSDYYVSRLIPDFYYETKFGWNYSPYVFTSRYLYTAAGFLLAYNFVFYNSVKDNLSQVKKYKFNVYTQPYLDYEEALILKEKSEGKKIIV